MKTVLRFLLRFYQLAISPMLTPSCRFIRAARTMRWKRCKCTAPRGQPAGGQAHLPLPPVECGRARSGAAGQIEFLYDRLRLQPLLIEIMDINKRTILWIVFAVSLFVLWNNWQISNGHPSMFAPPPRRRPRRLRRRNPTCRPRRRHRAAVPQVQLPRTPAVPVQGERITITTDVIRADIDTLGGVIRRLELLKFKDGHRAGSAAASACSTGARATTGKTYLAETGLSGAPGLPTHQTASWPSLVRAC
jgi:hypothetical protein